MAKVAEARIPKSTPQPLLYLWECSIKETECTRENQRYITLDTHKEYAMVGTSNTIQEKIEETMQYPGRIEVAVI